MLYWGSFHGIQVRMIQEVDFNSRFIERLASASTVLEVHVFLFICSFALEYPKGNLYKPKCITPICKYKYDHRSGPRNLVTW